MVLCPHPELSQARSSGDCLFSKTEPFHGSCEVVLRPIQALPCALHCLPSLWSLDCGHWPPATMQSLPRVPHGPTFLNSPLFPESIMPTRSVVFGWHTFCFELVAAYPALSWEVALARVSQAGLAARPGRCLASSANLPCKLRVSVVLCYLL